MLVLNSVKRLHSELALEVLGVDDLALRSSVALHDFGLFPEPSGAENEQVDCSCGLLGVTILGELAQAVDKFDEDFFEELEVVANGVLERLEALDYEVVLSVLGGEGENVEDDFPARLDVLCLQEAELGSAHHDVLLDFSLARVKVVEHDSFEGLEEHLLVAEVLPLFFLEELVGKLPQRINGVNHDIQILVLAHHGEVIAKRTPDALPLEAHSIHVERSDLYQFLEAELLWAVLL